MSDENLPVNFPTYSPPTGIPVAQGKQGAPLQKIVKTMMKLRHPKMARPRHSKPQTKKRWY